MDRATDPTVQRSFIIKGQGNRPHSAEKIIHHQGTGQQTPQCREDHSSSRDRATDPTVQRRSFIIKGQGNRPHSVEKPTGHDAATDIATYTRL